MASLTGTTHASLVSLGDGTVKDTATNLIWLQNWNLNGKNSWYGQTLWASDLTYAGSTDWRLPSIGEFITLFSEFGVLENPSLPFVNVVGASYWSSTELPSNLGEGATSFFIPTGSYLTGEAKGVLNYAVAVRIADATTVPAPQTLALALLGLALGTMASNKRLNGGHKPAALQT
jgi:hypothetical protein